MSKIKVAIAGVGNCTSSLVQGVEFYKNVNEKSGFVAGILHNIFRGYAIGDIEIVAAFDVDKNKVGKDIAEAIFSKPNCTTKFCEVRKMGVVVDRGRFERVPKNWTVV